MQRRSHCASTRAREDARRATAAHSCTEICVILRFAGRKRPLQLGLVLSASMRTAHRPLSSMQAPQMTPHLPLSSGLAAKPSTQTRRPCFMRLQMRLSCQLKDVRHTRECHFNTQQTTSRQNKQPQGIYILCRAPCRLRHSRRAARDPSRLWRSSSSQPSKRSSTVLPGYRGRTRVE